MIARGQAILLLAGWIALGQAALAQQPDNTIAAASAQAPQADYETLLARVKALEAQAASHCQPAVCLSAADDCCCCPRGRCYFAYDSVFLKPYFGSNGAFKTEDITGPRTEPDVIHEFDWDLEYSPRFEAGYLSSTDGWGGRVRYWWYDANASLASTPGDRNQFARVNVSDNPNLFIDRNPITTAAALELDVLDVEATLRRTWARTALTYGAGVRYARIEHQFLAVGNQPTLPPIQILAIQNNFEGVGPLLGVELQRRIGASPFGFFGGARAAILFGTSDLTGRRDSLDAAGVPTSEPERFFSENDDRAVGVFEAALGMEGFWELGRDWAVWLRIAAEGQYWERGGTHVTIELGGESQDASFPDPRNEDMGLLGLALRLAVLR